MLGGLDKRAAAVTGRVPDTIIPNPDPSLATSEAIDRRAENIEKVINARIDGIEKAVAVFQADLTRVPTQLDRAISALRDLLEARLKNIDTELVSINKDIHGREDDITRQIVHLKDLMSGRIDELGAVTAERFVGVGSQFAERDTRTDQRAGDTKLAVDAAFAAAKEATAKIEAGFTKSIEEIQRLLNATMQATNDKISDLKDRLTAIENRTIGITTATSGQRDTSNDASARVFSTISIVISILSIIAVAVVAAIVHH